MTVDDVEVGLQAQTHSPGTIFGTHIRYVVPLFQRPYVWNEREQWQPLWEDVTSLAEAVLAAAPAQSMYAGSLVPPHFLGAVVLDQKQSPSGYIAVRHVIDGQQRLTTLQLLIDAAQEVIEAHGLPMDASALRALVLNDVAVAQHPDEVFKVWPTTRDQDAFRAAMRNDVAVPEHFAASAIVRAHRFFVGQITSWGCEGRAHDEVPARLHALAQALAHHLKIVVIDLEQGDNAQVIFETLNHRGSPLLAADLIKNLLFQIASVQGADLEKLYQDFWAPFDSDHWRTSVTQGRLTRPRVDVFLNYWLTMKLAKEIPSDRIFVEFRDSGIHTGRSIAETMAELAHDARIFVSLDGLASSSTPGLFYYRVVRALDSAAVTPLLLWVMRGDVPVTERDRTLRAMESWLVRRALCRLTSKELNRAIVDLILQLNRSEKSQAGQVTEEFLGRARSDTRLWPDDEFVARVASSQPLYSTLTRPRLRMLLEALEDDARTQKSEAGHCPRNLTVEHVMPQAWREHWDPDELDAVAALQRDRLVQTLGNLTLVNNKLNPSMANRPWTTAEAGARGLGGRGKRAALLEHSVLKLNALLIATHENEWNEDAIRERGKALAQRLTAIWTRPTGLAPNAPDQLSDPVVTTAAQFIPAGPAREDEKPEIASAPVTGKYRPLYEWLVTQSPDVTELPVTFEDLEGILGFELPASARAWLPYWYGDHSVGKAARGARWRCSGVTLTQERLTFVRIARA